MAAGIMANTPTGRYRNAVAEGPALNPIVPFTMTLGIGTLRNGVSARQWYFDGNIQAIAIYNADIAAAIVPLTAAMAAL